MKNAIADFSDELVEQGKDIVKIAKNQIIGTDDKPAPEQDAKVEDKKQKPKQTSKKKVDPTTGKPVPSKQILRDLQDKVAQLQQAKLKQIREELDAQKLKVSEDKNKLSPIETAKKSGSGPIVESSEKEPKDNAVQATLKSSKSTGEFKGLIGG